MIRVDRRTEEHRSHWAYSLCGHSGIPAGDRYTRLKRTFDIVFAIFAILLLLPLGLLVALLIRLEDRGPIFYWHWRIGKDGKLFRFYKFRSMVPNADQLKDDLEAEGRNEADGPIFKMRDDPRVTRIGRFIRRYSIDELPQLIHVLRGEMSLVGPRPHLPREFVAYPDYPLERLVVRPGLLCLRELVGRSELSFDTWLELDLAYVRNRSFALDLRILGMVIPAIFRAEGAY